MLTFVGLGLYDERSITVEGREAVASADRVFAERYTSRLAGASVADLEVFHGVEIEVRDRDGVEGDPSSILEAASAGEAAFLVGGDPMVSTTHVDLRLRAHDRGVDTRIVHGTSASTAAAGLTGLQNYRFGKATTLPFPRGGGRGQEAAGGASAAEPAAGTGQGRETDAGRGTVGDLPPSVVQTVRDNRDRGLHTLVYLDIDAERDAFMTADEAAGRLADPLEDAIGVAVARAGSPDPVVAADRLSALAGRDFGDPLHLLAIPGDLHHVEAESLRAFAGAPAELLPDDRPGNARPDGRGQYGWTADRGRIGGAVGDCRKSDGRGDAGDGDRRGGPG